MGIKVDSIIKIKEDISKKVFYLLVTSKWEAYDGTYIDIKVLNDTKIAYDMGLHDTILEEYAISHLLPITVKEQQTVTILYGV